MDPFTDDRPLPDQVRERIAALDMHYPCDVTLHTGRPHFFGYERFMDEDSLVAWLAAAVGPAADEVSAYASMVNVSGRLQTLDLL